MLGAVEAAIGTPDLVICSRPADPALACASVSMLKLGQGCFWELFSPEWSRFMDPGDKAPTMPSYCHPWSSGVTAYLTKFSLGIAPLAPGFEQYVAKPHVSAAHPRVAGTVPTPRGPIAVNASWDVASCRAEVRVSAPVDAAGGVVGVRRNLELLELTVDGAVVGFTDAPPTAALPTGASVAQHRWRHRHHVYTPPLSGGPHVIRATYACGGVASTSPAFPPAAYPVEQGTVDRMTNGSWIGKYGAAGFARAARRAL